MYQAALSFFGDDEGTSQAHLRTLGVEVHSNVHQTMALIASLSSLRDVLCVLVCFLPRARSTDHHHPLRRAMISEVHESVQNNRLVFEMRLPILPTQLRGARLYEVCLKSSAPL